MCSLECNFKVALTTQKDKWLSKVLGCAGLTAAAWAVSLGGLASVQDSMLAASTNGDVGQLTPLIGGSNKTALRYYWFIAAWEAVVLAISAFVIMTGALHKWRGAVVGLLTVATLLYIQFADAFLGLRDVMDYGVEKDRANALVAGGIMTACLNAILLVLCGWVQTTSSDTPSVSVEVSDQANQQASS